MDIFDKKGIKPMLIAEMVDPFDSDDYIYELKLDGMHILMIVVWIFVIRGILNYFQDSRN